MMPHWLLKQSIFAALGSIHDVVDTLVDGMATLKEQGTPEQIAQFLLKENIRGWRGQAYVCPIAKFLNRELSVDPWLRPVLVSPGRYGVPLMGISILTPPQVDAFVTTFDAGAFRYLYPTTRMEMAA
jgi:hypothetical protein